MPNFNALAASALTPGGVIDGLSNLTRALTEGPLRARQAQQAQANRVAESLHREKQLQQALDIATMEEEGRANRHKESLAVKSGEDKNLLAALKVALSATPDYEFPEGYDPADPSNRVLGPAPKIPRKGADRFREALDVMNQTGFDTTRLGPQAAPQVSPQVAPQAPAPAPQPQPMMRVPTPQAPAAAGGKTVTLQQIQSRLKPGWTLERAVEYYKKLGYAVTQ